MNALVSAALWVVGKALTPIADGLLEAWGATKNLGLNIKALQMELLLVKVTLELASDKQIRGQAMEELLGKLRDLTHCAEDLLDELDYFRIHDELNKTYDATDHHAKGGVHNLALNARHAAKTVGKRVSCCAWPRARQSSDENSSSAPNANQEVSGCMPKLGKVLPCSSFPHVRDGNSGQSALCGAPQREHAEVTPMPEFNRVDVSERMKQIVEQLQPVRTEVIKILQSCDRITVPDIAQSRPITTAQSVEPKLYGRDDIVNTIIDDMTKDKYHGKDLTVLPIVGPGGIGKTTLIQHIYRNQKVQNHFQVVIWVCVSLRFNLNKLLEEIKTHIPRVEGEKYGRVEELIEQRLKSKRFLLILDDIWEFSDRDDWERLLLPLKASQEKGSMILLTTRFPAIASMVETTDHIELKGLKSEEFRKLFFAFVFGDETFKSDHKFLLEIGDKIMGKLKGSPLAAKTVGTLLRKDLNLRHWIRVLESKEWEKETGVNDIMPALKLSYDYLPFQQQKCFSYSALFPEDHKYSATELVNLWIGLDILQPDGQNQTIEDKGLRNLNDLITHGFFREEKTHGRLHYVMHDLLHDLALKVASHECLTLHHSNIRSVGIHPSICHLSIIVDYNDLVSHENFKCQLRKLKARLKVKQLHTLMLFGERDESFANILGDLFREAKSVRVLHLVNMPSSVESMLHNFSTLVHLRYLRLGTKSSSQMHLPLRISRFYHLKILDLRSWYEACDLPKDLSNLAKLRHLYTSRDELHSDIVNVGKLIHLVELKIFRINKESAGFEPKQLEHLAELRELGIYNLENIHTEEEAAKANLIEKNYLERLTLDWDSGRSNREPAVEEVVLESLQPHGHLQELCIRGHGGHFCPTWLGDKLVVAALHSLCLVGVSWECLPPLGKLWGLDTLILEHIAAMQEFVIEQSFCRLIRLELVGLGSFEKWVASEDAHHMFPLLQVLIIRDCPKLLELPFSNHILYPKKDEDWNVDWFPKLQELEINKCSKFLLVAHIPWSETLRSVDISDVKLLKKMWYNSKSSNMFVAGKDGLQSLDRVVAFNKLTGLEELTLENCPPLEWKHLLMLTSLKTLGVDTLGGLVGPSGGEAYVEWQHPVVQGLMVGQESHGGPSGKDLTELLTHLPSLSKFSITRCKNIKYLAVRVDLQQPASATTSEVEQQKEEEDGLLLFPAYLCDSLRLLSIGECPSAFLPARGGGGGFQALRSLQSLHIWCSPQILAAKSYFSCCLFPSSLQYLSLCGVGGLGTLEPLSNLTSLTQLYLVHCGGDLRCKGLGPLLTTGEQLRELRVTGSPRFFDGWDPNLRRVVQGEGGEEEALQELISPTSSSKLQRLETDSLFCPSAGACWMELFVFLSSSLTHLTLVGTYQDMERFTKEQEDALLLLASLQELEFQDFNKLESLPTGLHKLTNLKRLMVMSCPAVRSLPEDGLPKSLQELDAYGCGNKDLRQQCMGLVGTIRKIKLEWYE